MGKSETTSRPPANRRERRHPELVEQVLAGLVQKRYLSAADIEAETGIPKSTARYWAWHDERLPAEERVGPPSMKLGRRRVWERESFENWLAQQEAKASA
jgi:hypothetical protein